MLRGAWSQPRVTTDDGWCSRSAMPIRAAAGARRPARHPSPALGRSAPATQRPPGAPPPLRRPALVAVRRSAAHAAPARRAARRGRSPRPSSVLSRIDQTLAHALRRGSRLRHRPTEAAPAVPTRGRAPDRSRRSRPRCLPPGPAIPPWSSPRHRALARPGWSCTWPSSSTAAPD